MRSSAELCSEAYKGGRGGRGVTDRPACLITLPPGRLLFSAVSPYPPTMDLEQLSHLPPEQVQAALAASIGADKGLNLGGYIVG